MKWRNAWQILAVAATAVVLAAAGCGGGRNNTNVVTVVVSPSNLALVVNQVQNFTAIVTGNTNTAVTWSCTFTTTTTTTTNGTSTTTTSTPAPCTDKDGVLSNQADTTVTYTAPATVQNPLHTIQIVATSKADTKKTGTAQVVIDSGIRVSVIPSTATLATGESFTFNAGVTNDVAPPNGGVTWSVTNDATATSTSASCAPGCGSVDAATGKFTAPATLPTKTTTTLVAASKADSSRLGQAIVSLINASTNPISFTGISPSIAPQGGLFQDVYLNAKNLRTSVQVFFNGSPISTTTNALKIIPIPSSTCTPSTTVTCDSSVLARLRLNSDQLAVPGDFKIEVQDPVTLVKFAQTISIKPYRPALISASPDSFQFNSATAPSVTLNGGLFGSPTSPLPAGQFNGQLRGVTPKSARQLQVNLNNATDLATPGLFSVGIVNSGATPSTALTNVSVQPDYASTDAPTPITGPSLSTPNTFNGPSAIAIDSKVGVAIVANEANATVQLINLNGGSPVLSGSAVSVRQAGDTGTSPKLPTSVGIDDQLLPNHVAAVVNSGDSTVSILQMPASAAGAVTLLGSANLSAFFPPASSSFTPPKPYAVGVDPYSHLALIAYSSTNVGLVLNLDPALPQAKCLVVSPAQTAPYCVVSTVTLNTGAGPQVAVQPQVHLALVSPGGSGLLSVVDLQQRGTTLTILTTGGAVRSGNVVTIKTQEKNGINPAVGGTILITGVASSTFNGSFQITSVPDDFTLTYSQTGADETSGGGNARFGNPVLTFSVSPTEQGVAINPITRTAALADPNASGAQIAFISTLDQSVTSLGLSAGSFLNNPGSGPEVGARFVAFQPFTNTLVSYNPLRNEISVIDPTAPQRLAQATKASAATTAIGTFTSGSSTITVNGALAVDPVTNLALAANAFDNTVSVVKLSDPAKLQPVEIVEARVTSGGLPGALLPQAVVATSAGTAQLQLFGRGFAPTTQVRLDGDSIAAGGGTVTFVSGQELDVTIPASPFLLHPRRYALDMLSGGALSNVTDFTVVGSVDVSGGCGTGTLPKPTAVAIDDQRDLAVVSNSGCNNVAVIDVNPQNATFGTIVTPPVAVGTSPAGVAVIPRLGMAVVANNGSSNASIIDLTAANPTVKSTVTVGTSPLGVAINQDTARAIVVNNGSNTVSSIDLNAATPAATTGAVDQQPIAVAIDADRGIAVVTALQFSQLGAGGVLDVVDISTPTPTKNSTLSVSGLTATPTGIAFDPAVSPALFYATSSQGNTITALNPSTAQTQTFRVGVNPTSLAYNYQTSTLLSVNSISNTISVIDSQTFRTRATLAVGGSSQFAAAIHPRTNLAVITDQANNRVLLLPLPR